VQYSGVDINKLVIPEVPLPARILESTTANKKKQSKSATGGKATRRKAVSKATQKRKAK
jgi:hypothetical protein